MPGGRLGSQNATSNVVRRNRAGRPVQPNGNQGAARRNDPRYREEAQSYRPPSWYEGLVPTNMLSQGEASNDRIDPVAERRRRGRAKQMAQSANRISTTLG